MPYYLLSLVFFLTVYSNVTYSMNLFGRSSKASYSYNFLPADDDGEKNLKINKKNKKIKQPKTSESHTAQFQHVEHQNWYNKNKQYIIKSLIEELENYANPNILAWTSVNRPRKNSPVIFFAFFYGRNHDRHGFQPFTPEENQTVIKAWLASPFKKINLTGSDIKEESTVSMLYLACLYNYTATVEDLLKADADPNLGDKIKLHTPLHVVAQKRNDIALVHMLINAKADIDALNAQGDTPLAIAAYFGHHDIVEILIEARADLTKVGDHGHSALYTAAHQNRPSIIEILLKHGLDPNFQAGDDTSALYVAARQGHEKVVEFLLNIPGIKIDQGAGDYSPFFIALEKRHLLIATMILKKHPAMKIGGFQASQVYFKANPEALMQDLTQQIRMLELKEQDL